MLATLSYPKSAGSEFIDKKYLRHYLLDFHYFIQFYHNNGCRDYILALQLLGFYFCRLRFIYED